MPLTAGTRLGPYEILHPLGAGGMGEVYRARQLALRRDVALKILPEEFANDPARLARFEREARTASALNHPNIVVIHDVATHDGMTYIVMELVEGRTLRDIIALGPLSIDRILRLASQIADGLARAHAAGIVHRDIKPANVMVTSDDLVKILDFGLAKPLVMTGRATTVESVEGTVVGTPLYMSPEQVSGDRVDHRSDQFSLGVVLYEMVAGKAPFDELSLVRAILTADPPPLKRLRPDAPADLERLIRRCLEKDPGKRPASTGEIAAELGRLQERRTRARHGLVARLKRPATAATVGAVVLALGAAGALWARGAEERWARGEALAEITAFAEAGALYDAVRTARRAEKYRPGDAALAKMVNRITLPGRVSTEPSGAQVWVKGYATPDAAWEPIGITPVSLRIPYALMRWRIIKAGYEPFEGAPFSGIDLRILAEGLVLDSSGTRPPGMVRVPAGRSARAAAQDPLRTPAAEVGSYFLDRFEVTNREFKGFLDGGGYREPRWWPAGIATDAFRDATGRHGPSTWQLGTYPADEDDYPVGGISWYEAAAYCAFVGKSLPTIHHWTRAIGQEQFSEILLHSNIGSGSKARVGQFKGLAAYGTYDMAGNVKEWTWNATGDKRYILGGAWNEPAYVFRHLIARDPLAREPTHGVRCAKYIEPPSEALLAPVTPLRQFVPPEPVSEETFALFRGMYTYDQTPLQAEVVRVNDSIPDYRRETVSIRTAYADERMQIHLYIPRNAAPPYQSVIWYPGDDVFILRSSDVLSTAYLVDFIPRSGRVLVQPVYEAMYERWQPRTGSSSEVRDLMIRWSQDIGRTIDYLETRPELDTKKIAYYGLSGGANRGPVFTAVEPRIAAAILLGGGGGLMRRERRPETNVAHFAPRSRVPTLMINGRDDFLAPYETAQKPFFELLGAPADKKRHTLLDGGHMPADRLAIIREMLDWLDLQLGPVRPATAVASVPETQ